MSADKIFDFDKELNQFESELTTSKESIDAITKNIDETSEEIDTIYEQLKGIPGLMRVIETETEDGIDELEIAIERVLELKYKEKIDFSAIDVIVAIIAGVVASVIDIVFVGTPEVVKIYRGGENFDGSILTGIIREIGNGDDTLSEMLHWLSEKCKVPYDISVKKDIVNPNNHRLRNPGHDPLLGLLFAIVDILMGTATVIGNDGQLNVILRDKKYPDSEKFLSVIYYFGHLLSDVCTARGLPIPGFFLTQFFTNGEYGPNDDSIARIAEDMYKDGYDFRHLISMATPVMIKDFIIKIYIKLFHKESFSVVDSIANKEIQENKEKVFQYKLLAVSDAVACGGNVIKFFLPPTSGNPTALNLPEWTSLITNTVISLKYDLRDKSVDQAIYNREIIDENWKRLINNI
ncbi:MAG: coiled-coil domain-containing protein [Eubacterium sp.]